MATSPVPQWARETSPTHTGPTAGGVLRLAVLVIIMVIAYQWFAATDSGRSQVDTRQGVSLCEEHAGDPGWAACASRSRSRPSASGACTPSTPRVFLLLARVGGMRRVLLGAGIGSCTALPGAPRPLSPAKPGRERGGATRRGVPAGRLGLTPFGTAFGGDLDG